MTWQVQVRDESKRFHYSVHLGHPTRVPETDQPGIYMAPHDHVTMAQHFPIGAADVWAEGVPGWRLVCCPRRKPVVDVLSAFACLDDPPVNELGGVTCTDCRRWAHQVRRHRHVVSRVSASA